MTVDETRAPAVPARGNHLDQVRRRNLSLVLRLVHRAGSVPRSGLTRATGLNRSTVGALVAELGQLGLVQETEPDPTNAVGRPSPTVRADPGVVAIAVNPEIDAVTVALVGLDGTEHRRVRQVTDGVPTPSAAIDVVRGILAELRTELADMRTVGIGVAVPGLVREEDGFVRLAPHLAWVDEPFAERLAQATGFPVRAANDANLGAAAEHLYGSGRSTAHLIYLNGGASGIGGGVISADRPLTGAAGYAGEFGHTLVNSSGTRCHCGAIGCLETEVNQRALLHAAGIPGHPELLAGLLEAGPDAALAAEAERQLGFLAVALRNALHTVNPEVIVLGGFLGALHAFAGERLIGLVAAQTMVAAVENVRIVRAELGSAVLLRGAAELVFEPLLADPAGPWGLGAAPSIRP